MPSPSVHEFHLVEEPADLRDLLGGRGSAGERAEHEAFGRSSEDPVEQVTDHVALDIGLVAGRAEDLRSNRSVAFEQALLGHDLHELQDRRVADLLSLGEFFIDLADRRRYLAPR